MGYRLLLKRYMAHVEASSGEAWLYPEQQDCDLSRRDLVEDREPFPDVNAAFTISVGDRGSPVGQTRLHVGGDHEHLVGEQADRTEQGRVREKTDRAAATIEHPSSSDREHPDDQAGRRDASLIRDHEHRIRDESGEVPPGALGIVLEEARGVRIGDLQIRQGRECRDGDRSARDEGGQPDGERGQEDGEPKSCEHHVFDSNGVEFGDHVSPAVQHSFFQIGISIFSRSIVSRHASNASARCRDAASIRTLSRPTGTSPTAWRR